MAENVRMINVKTTFPDIVRIKWKDGISEESKDIEVKRYGYVYIFIFVCLLSIYIYIYTYIT